MPFPSRGCRTCRQRHLKCDEIRPICGQCKKSSRICLGFEVEQDTLPFRSENAYASGVARRSRRPKANESRKATIERTVISHSHKETAVERIPRGLDIPLEVLALNCYIQSHVFSAEHLPVNVQSWIQSLICVEQAKKSDSMLSSIVSAASLATFGRIETNPEALQLGSRKYIQALTKTKTVINDPNEAVTDQLLMTVIMLGVYEHAVSNYDKRFLLAESFRHHVGALTILNLRRKAQYQSVTPLDRVVRNLIIKQAVLHAAALPEWIQDGAEFGEEGVQLGMDVCLVKLALLRKQSQDFWRNVKALENSIENESLQAEAQNLIEEAIAVDQMLTQWAANLPLDWTFITQGDPSPGPDVRPSIEQEGVDRLQYGSTISLYPNFEQAATWNRYQASRMITNSVMLRTLSYTAPHGAIRAQQIACREEVQSCVDQICASVPYHFDVMGTNSESPRTSKPRLDNVNARKAYILAWPLTIAMAAATIPEHQRQWIRAKILLVSRITGNGALELVANLDRNINLRGDSHNMSKQRLKEIVPQIQ